jgi:hypothetical protein
MAEQNQDGQKTIVAFVVGLLIGGMLVWAFSGPSDQNSSNTKADSEKSEQAGDSDSTSDESAEGDKMDSPDVPKLSVGEGNISVPDQAPSKSITMDNATYPVGEGWIGVRNYDNGELGRILGVVRFSESQGLVPEAITLLTPTVSGKEYAVVVFKEDGDFDFNLAGDVQIDQIFDTFKAQ